MSQGWEVRGECGEVVARVRWRCTVLLVLAAGCASEPPAWELENPVLPLPEAPLGSDINLASLPEPPTPARVRLGRWLFFDNRLP